MFTLDVDQVIYGLLQTELLDEECLLLFGDAIEEVLEVSVPDLSYFGEETLSNGLVAHVHEDLAKQEVVLSHVGMLRAPFSGLEIDLVSEKRYCVFEFADGLAIVILEFIEFGEGAMQVDLVIQLLSAWGKGYSGVRAWPRSRFFSVRALSLLLRKLQCAAFKYSSAFLWRAA